MKKTVLLLIIMISGLWIVKAQPPGGISDSQAAKKPGEQIRKYYFVMLTKGDNQLQDSSSAAKIQEAHLNNINRLYNEGKLKVAGPFGGKGTWRGLFIFDCNTQEEVEQYLKTDPAISLGRLTYEIHPWYTAPIGSFVPGKPEKKY